ncbi:MAG: hypothetical protein V1855_05025 [bacterium]
MALESRNKKLTQYIIEKHRTKITKHQDYLADVFGNAIENYTIKIIRFIESIAKEYKLEALKNHVHERYLCNFEHYNSFNQTQLFQNSLEFIAQNNLFNYFDISELAITILDYDSVNTASNPNEEKNDKQKLYGLISKKFLTEELKNIFEPSLNKKKLVEFIKLYRNKFESRQPFPQFLDYFLKTHGKYQTDIIHFFFKNFKKKWFKKVFSEKKIAEIFGILAQQLNIDALNKNLKTKNLANKNEILTLLRKNSKDEPCSGSLDT